MLSRAFSVVAFVLLLGGRAAADAPGNTAQGLTPLERGTQRFVAGDFVGAIAPLEEAHQADPHDPDAALLLGIAYFRVGRDSDAVPMLEIAETSTDEQSQASARVFLGLIADRRGQAGRARSYYALVARSRSALGTSGRLLLQHDGPERWSLVGIVRGGYDSNVSLQPSTPGRGGKAPADAELMLIGGATARPLPDVGLVIDETILYRMYASETAYNLLLDIVGATYTAASSSNRLSLAYHFDGSLLGGERYELAHVADVAVRHAVSETSALGLHYTGAARDYAPMTYVGYTGLYHEAGAEVVWGSPAASTEGSLGYVFERQSTNDDALASTGHGARLQLRSTLSPRTELQGTVFVVRRGFDVDRTDLVALGDATLFVDLGGGVGALVGATFSRNASSDANFDTSKWTVFAGLTAVHAGQNTRR